MRTRRAALGLLGAACVAGAARAHTPYRQWVVYRQKHLLIGSHRGDPQTYALAQAVVEALDETLPSASARVARGPRPQRIVSLMATDQLMVAVVSMGEADAMTRADPPFDGYEPLAVRQLASLAPGYGLFAAPTFPDDHAWLLVEAVASAGLGTAPDAMMPAHPGAAAFWAHAAQE